nr:MAG TPA: hypothetical protein [Caudoviricetes sp.]
MQHHVAIAIRCPAARAIIPGARWCVVCVSLDVSGCAPSPLPPGGSGKTGRLSGGSPCVTTHSLLRLPAKHRPAQRKFNPLRFPRLYNRARLSKGIPYIFWGCAFSFFDV